MHFGVAKFLQEKYPCDLYAIIDVPDRRKTFFEKQKIIKFEKTWYYNDNINLRNKKPDLPYLEYIEKKYNVNLWLLVINERIFYSNEYYKFTREEILAILEHECRLFEEILNEIKLDFLVILTNLHQNHLFYQMCKSQNVKILLFSTARLGNRCIISSEEDFIDIKNNYTLNYNSTRSLNNLQEILKKFNKWKNATTNASIFTFSKINLIKATLQYLFFSKNVSIKTNYAYFGRMKLKVILYSIIDLIRIRQRTNFINKNFIKSLEYDTPFIFFPLHQEPEKTLLKDAPFHTNQIEIIKHIAKSLPIGYKLYVKEHVSQILRSWRPIPVYKKLLDLPNVVLIHPSVLPSKIIQKCALVITIRGTAGFEALFYGKPSIVFGNVLYKNLSSVTTVKNFEDLPYIIRSLLEKKVNLNELNHFVDFLLQNSFEFDWDGFEILANKYFAYGGYLSDITTTEEQVKLFLKEEESTFNKLVDEYIKKINWYKHNN